MPWKETEGWHWRILGKGDIPPFYHRATCTTIKRGYINLPYYFVLLTFVSGPSFLSCSPFRNPGSAPEGWFDKPCDDGYMYYIWLQSALSILIFCKLAYLFIGLRIVFQFISENLTSRYLCTGYPVTRDCLSWVMQWIWY